MKYLMFVGMDPDRDPGGTDPTGTLDVEEWVERHDAAGRRLIGERVRPASDATTVRRRGGKLLVTDGPYVETHEWIVGFDVLECADLAEAIAVAAEHPMSVGGRLELRPFWEDDD